MLVAQLYGWQWPRWMDFNGSEIWIIYWLWVLTDWIHEHYWTSMNLKSRLGVKYNTRGRGLTPATLPHWIPVRSTLTAWTHGGWNEEGSKGRDAWESGFNEAEGRPTFQPASLVVDFSAARTSWRRSNIHFVSKHDTLVLIVSSLWSPLFSLCFLLMWHVAVLSQFSSSGKNIEWMFQSSTHLLKLSAHCVSASQFLLHLYILT